jgi:nucleoid-associated protein YgaU
MISLMSGCQAEEKYRTVNEEEEPGFRRARQLLREGRKEEALHDFLRLIQHRGEAPESHLEVAQLYLHDFKNPLLSYYHYDRYLALRPDSSKAELVRGQLQAARREFIRTLPGNPLAGQLDRIELADQVATLARENENLRRKVQVLESELELTRRAQPAAAKAVIQAPQPAAPIQPIQPAQPAQPVVPAPAPAPVQQAAPAAPATARDRKYEVVRGDTLSNISRKVYGHPGGWERIYNANRDQLPNQNALRPGQVLRIPAE